MSYILRLSIVWVLVFICAASIASNIHASAKSIVKGIVLDNETDETVPGAVIRIVESNRFFTSDIKGEFIIPDMLYGEYTFEISHLAYRENVSKILVSEQSDAFFAFYLVPKSIEINPVVVTDFKSFSKFDDLAELSNVLKGKELQRELGLSLASSLKNETGLAIRSMGPAPARPVIRGLGSDRVLISEDGVKSVDLSATSPDHAVTIDPFNLQRIEVLRGPKVLLKTSTTIGGVVNVIRNEIPTTRHDHIFGSIGTYVETANSGYLGSALIEAPISDFAIRGEISRRRTFNLATPAGKLKNSYSENINYSVGATYFASFGYFGFSSRQFDLDYGVPGGFVGAHPFGVDISMYRQQFNSKAHFNLDSEIFRNLDVNVSSVLYRHKEFEASGSIGSEFRITELLGSAELSHDKFLSLDNGLVGISFESRKFQVGGFVFTSPSKALNLSSYIYENFSHDEFSFEFGARYNYDVVTPDEEKYDSKIGFIHERIFNTYSLSFSALYELTKIVYIGFNVSKSSRIPTIEELYSRGPHLAAYSYETGNPELEAEKGFGLEAYVYHKFKDLYWNFNIFRNDLHYYIIPRKTDQINLQTFLPVYQTYGVPALFYGIENQLDWTVFGNIILSNTLSYTRGNFKGSDKSLPQIPPLKGKVEIKSAGEDLSFGTNIEWAAAQQNVDRFEIPTAGYIVYNFFLLYSINTKNLIHSISLNCDNILNTEYRNHLSRVKSILPEAGRNFRLTYKLYFNY